MFSRHAMVSRTLSMLSTLTLSRSRFALLRIAVCVIVVLVALPRFDMNDFGVSAVTGDVSSADTAAVSSVHSSANGIPNGMPNGIPSSSSPDVRQYTALVHFFRGEHEGESPAAPFAYRMLIPFIASFVPAPALTAIDLVNLLVLVLCVLFVDALLSHFSMSYVERIMGMLLFAMSFPVFYYGATGRVDAGGILLMLVMMYAHAGKHTALFWTALVIAPAAKETTVIAIVYCLVMELRNSVLHARRNAIMMLVVYALATVIVRKVSPAGAAHVWSPSMNDIMTNLVRPRAYISSVLAFGPLGFLAFYEIIKGRREVSTSFRTACLVAVVASLLTWAYSFVAAYTDGRFVWLAYPFLIPLAVLGLRRVMKSA